jgi:hypothetical protein
MSRAENKQSSPIINLVKPSTGTSSEKMAIARVNEGSVSNLVSLSNSDSNSYICNPLERELNLTEYELRIRAANG